MELGLSRASAATKSAVICYGAAGSCRLRIRWFAIAVYTLLWFGESGKISSLFQALRKP